MGSSEGNDVLELFHPATRAWFASAFAAPTAAQLEAWPAIKAGRHALVAAPTGSGKTLAAFLAAIDALVREGIEHGLTDETHVLYVSPLKALSNDIQRNLEAPVAGVRAELERLGLPDVEIRTQVRTGDTPQSERASMRRRPPHIVVTTPESLYILLTSRSGRRMLATTPTVIVAERAAGRVSERRGDQHVPPHQGRPAPARRLDAERRLRRGEWGAGVPPASLELGIGIGEVGLVCQIGSTGSIAALLQRVGRSG